MLKDENLGKNFQKGMDKFQNMDYNGNESGGQSDAEAWKSENSEALKYAGDEALRSVDKGLSEARDFPSEAKKDVNFRDVQDASVKWALAADSNNEELSNSARDELIGILGEGDPEPYMSDVRPLAEFVEAKDNFDYQNGNYTTTENMDKNYDEGVLNMQTSLKENGYTDKFGDPIKPDGYLGGKTMFAMDAYSSDQAVAEPVAMAASSHSRAKAASVNNSSKSSGSFDHSKIAEYKKTDAMNSFRYGYSFDRTPTSNQIKSYITHVCNIVGLPADIGLAVAYTESRMRQFVYDKSSGGYVVNVAGDDYGMMQINKTYHLEAFSDNKTYGDVRNSWQDNVWYGIVYFKECYDEAKRYGYTGENLLRAAYSNYNSGSCSKYTKNREVKRNVNNFMSAYNGKGWTKIK